ncbi:MAG TPA: TMEM175 family protein [Streptosporangiaceae bacterium]|jgi:uncharacterized membrane protein|nr:TMEM175 family protein [Streptosporangiaceae bacterium]
MSTEPAPAGGSDAAAAKRDDLPSVDRLLTLSDGVVAIALTLLVLQLTVPSKLANPQSASDLAAQLGHDADQLISYVISFYVIAHFWLIHHRVFRQLSGQQEGLAWWNFAFLFTITIMPFTSALLGQYASNPLAVGIFALNLLVASLATQATLDLGRRRGLLTADSDVLSRRAGLLRTAATAVILLVNRWAKRRAARTGDPAPGA